MRKILIIFSLIIFGGVSVAAGLNKGKLKVYSPLGDHMVLQRDAELLIKGEAGILSPVSVEIAGQKGKTRAGITGKWKIKLNPLKAGGPYDMSVKSGEELVIKDILIGDVWFCSGQSNMEWPLINTDDGAEELKSFKTNDKIRLFLQQQVPSPKPLKEARGNWAVCDKGNASNFSAIGYFMGKKIYEETGVPVGIIDSSWGGTSIEIWMDEKILAKHDETKPILKRWKENPQVDWKLWNYGKGMSYSLEIKDICFKSGKKNDCIKLSESGNGIYGGSWSAWAKPGSSAEYDAGKLSGIIGFYAWAGAGTLLDSGKPVDISGYDTISFKVKGAGDFSFSFTQDSIQDYDYYSSPDYKGSSAWKEISVPIKSLKQAGWGKASDFTPEAVVQFQINIKSAGIELPSSLYNGMVVPYYDYRIKGAAWYQGENNASRAKQYSILLPEMIKNWRKGWGYDFPFLVVQLTSFMQRKNEPSESEWAELREAQLSALQLKNTAVIPIIDLGDANDIHPKIKKPVGERLANAAMAVAYGKDVTVTGPLYKSMKKEENKIIIKFTNTGKGLKCRGKELKGFAIAGSDMEFVWANAVIKDNTVEVWSEEVKEPVAVRYAWADNPECNLYNSEGLAASPFRTDNNPGITDKRR